MCIYYEICYNNPMFSKYLTFTIKQRILIQFIVIVSLVGSLITGCSSSNKEYVSSSTTIRDNTPRCLVPQAPGKEVAGNELISIDYSNSGEGYLMITYTGNSNAVKLQITGPDYMTYTYDIVDNSTECFPISAGDGSYTIGAYEQIEGTQYSVIYSDNFEFNITNEYGAYLYPNQYVKFDKDSNVVAKASELVAQAHDDLEAINFIYNYLINTITYDTPKAENAQGGYIPDVDEILDIKTGICIDYAAVMTSMLRSQNIPTRMEIGYAGSAYHAWISTYVENVGWINGVVEFNGENWSLMDPTVAASSGDKKLKKYIGDKDNTYMKQFTY